MDAKKRNIITAGVVIVLLAFWLTVKAGAEKEAKKAILDSPLDDLIEFNDLSVGLLDKSVTLYDVEFSLIDEDKAPVLEAITLVGFDKLSEWLEDESSFPEVLSIQITGLKFDLHEMLKNQATSGLLDKMALYGYQSADFEGGMQINYDEDDQLLNLSVNVYADNVGEVTFETKLSRVRERLLDSLRTVEKSNKDASSIMMTALIKLQELKTNSAKVALNHLSIEVDDNGFIDKFNRFYAIETIKLPGEKYSYYDAKQREKDIKNMTSDGIPKSLAIEFANKLTEFFESSSSIAVETDIDNPIRLSKLMSEKSQIKAIKRLNLEVR